MNPSSKANWLVPGGLLLLAFVPIAAGTMRVFELARGGEITPDNARFFSSPLPVVLHIVSASVFSLIGAFQFSPGLRRRQPHWHRIAGSILVPCGLIAALSGLWLTQHIPLGNFTGTQPANHDGYSLYIIRLIAGSAMAVSLCLGIAAIFKREFSNHGAWMIRAYALGLGAGTQALTHIPWFLFPSIQGESARTLCMAAGWVINVAVTEWAIARERCSNLYPGRKSPVSGSGSLFRSGKDEIVGPSASGGPCHKTGAASRSSVHGEPEIFLAD